MSTDLLSLADDLEATSREFQSEHNAALKALNDAAAEMQKSWSGSNLGYHALVYYRDLTPRPPGAQFSVEWGLNGNDFLRIGSVGEWQEYSSDAIKDVIYNRAGFPNIENIREDSKKIAVSVRRARDEILSALTVALEEAPDEFLGRLKSDAESATILTYVDLCRNFIPKGARISRDSNAVMAGLQVAPHQEIIAEAASFQVPCDVALELSEIARRAGSHLCRKESRKLRSKHIGVNVFIGHGRSLIWRALKDFIVDRLNLPYEEFNRVPVAGVTNIARLSEMLDGAGCALIILTAEDEQKDGSVRARMNVIHEVGLFQGRLGFTKAIVVLEDGCEEFTNIQGLGQIRFPKGNIAAAFEDIRSLLEREGML